ncbi:MAG: asparaginase [Streptosporangiales bacterium]|nr:asparaginase [Streptosporangiales bacterium]
MAGTNPPRVAVFTMGGTIASVSHSGPGVRPRLSADELVSAVPGLAEAADIDAVSFRQVASPELTLRDLTVLAATIERRFADGYAGAVVTQGTDTIEETAFALDLLLDADAPVVVTGAMRNPTLPGADGPANLLAAVRVAASGDCRGLGCLVVLNDEIHAARFVRKTHTTNPATFRSEPAGPIGWLAEGTPHIALRPIRRHHIPVADDVDPPPIALLTVGLGDDGRLLGEVERLGYAGVVVEAMGGGHVPAHLVPALASLARRVPVVLASRTGAGEVLRETYGFPGSETDLLEQGAIPAGALDGLKARILLMLLLARKEEPDGIRAAFPWP